MIGSLSSPFQKLWTKWKSLRLPWRTQILVGTDLKRNTYWEFPDARGMGSRHRMRRIVKYPRGTHLGDVKVSPMWHQWLRHQRLDPPTIQEQQLEEARQDRIKILAAQADARWEAKPRLAGDSPAAINRPTGPRISSTEPHDRAAAALEKPSHQESSIEPPEAQQRDSDPWKKAAGQGEKWQPEAWAPSPKKK